MFCIRTNNEIVNSQHLILTILYTRVAILNATILVAISLILSLSTFLESVLLAFLIITASFLVHASCIPIGCRDNFHIISGNPVLPSGSFHHLNEY